MSNLPVPDGTVRWRVTEVYTDDIGDHGLIKVSVDAYITKGEAWPKINDVLMLAKDAEK